MKTSEGTYRIRLLAKRIMLFGSLAGISLWILMFVLKSGGEESLGSFVGRPGMAELFILIAAPIACGAILWLVAWILEGFMTFPRHE